MNCGGEAPCFPWPPKEKREHWGEIYSGVYPHEGFRTQRFKWGQDMKDARSQLSIQAHRALPAPAHHVLQDQGAGLARFVSLCWAAPLWRGRQP